MGDNAATLGIMFFVGLLTLYVAVMGRLGSLLAAIINPSALEEGSATSTFSSPANTGSDTSTVGQPLAFQQGSYQAMAIADAKKYGIDPNVFVKQIDAESGFNPKAVSPSGAQGIAQFMPSTAAGLGVNPFDPVASLDAAARLDAQNLRAYGGDYRKMLAAYNAGGGAVNNAVRYYGSSWLSHMPIETQNYVRRVYG